MSFQQSNVPAIGDVCMACGKNININEARYYLRVAHSKTSIGHPQFPYSKDANPNGWVCETCSSNLFKSSTKGPSPPPQSHHPNKGTSKGMCPPPQGDCLNEGTSSPPPGRREHLNKTNQETSREPSPLLQGDHLNNMIQDTPRGQSIVSLPLSKCLENEVCESVASTVTMTPVAEQQMPKFVRETEESQKTHREQATKAKLSRETRQRQTAKEHEEGVIQVVHLTDLRTKGRQPWRTRQMQTGKAKEPQESQEPVPQPRLSLGFPGNAIITKPSLQSLRNPLKSELSVDTSPPSSSMHQEALPGTPVRLATLPNQIKPSPFPLLGVKVIMPDGTMDNLPCESGICERTVEPLVSTPQQHGINTSIANTGHAKDISQAKRYTVASVTSCPPHVASGSSLKRETAPIVVKRTGTKSASSNSGARKVQVLPSRNTRTFLQTKPTLEDSCHQLEPTTGIISMCAEASTKNFGHPFEHHFETQSSRDSNEGMSCGRSQGLPSTDEGTPATDTVVPILTFMNKNCEVLQRPACIKQQTGKHTKSSSTDDPDLSPTVYYVKGDDGRLWLLTPKMPLDVKDSAAVIPDQYAGEHPQFSSGISGNVEDSRRQPIPLDMAAQQPEYRTKRHTPAILNRNRPKQYPEPVMPEEPPPAKRKYVRSKKPKNAQLPTDTVFDTEFQVGTISAECEAISGSPVTVKMECSDEECASYSEIHKERDHGNGDKYPGGTKRRPLMWNWRKKYCLASNETSSSNSKIAVALNLLSKKKYKSGLKALVKSSRIAKKAVIWLANLLAVREAKSVCQSDSVIDGLSSEVTPENLMSFTWDKVKDELEEKMPLTFAVMSAIVMRETLHTKPGQKYKLGFNVFYQFKPELHRHRCAKLVTSMSILLHRNEEHETSTPQTNSFLQRLLSLVLGLRDIDGKVLGYLGYLNLCLPKKIGARQVQEFLSELQNHLSLSVVEHEVTKIPAFNAEVKPMDTHPVLPCANYGLCFRNIQSFMSQSAVKELGFPPYIAMPFAVVHRVTTDVSEPKFKTTTKSGKPACTLPASTFLPVQKDYTELRHYMVETVKMILVEHVPCLESLQTLLTKEHRKRTSIRHHEKSQEMAEKSEFLAMDTIVGATEGGEDDAQMDKIVDHLQTVIPKDGERQMPVVVHSDADSLDLMVDKINVDEITDEMIGRDNLLVSGPEFHKETQLLQDLVDKLHNLRRGVHRQGSSSLDRGSLLQIRDLFYGPVALNPVQSYFKRTWNLTKLTTEGFTLLLAMKYAGMATLDSIPSNFPEDSSTQLMWLTTLARNIVDRVWKQPSNEELHIAYKSCATDMGADEQGSFRYCCGKDIGGDMLRCFNGNCPKVFIHQKCARKPPKSPDEDWYCRITCSQAARLDYIYCSCRRWKEEDMVQCQRKKACRRAEWYHFSCANPLAKSADDFPEEWYCSEECTLDEQDDDGVLEYSLSLLWHGLNLLVRRDIVREGNGPMMLQMWKIDMLQFWENNHNKLLRLGHRLLAYTGGFMPEYVAHDITWNRVANPTGKSGDNLPLDQVIETKFTAVRASILRITHASLRMDISKTYSEYCCRMGCTFSDINNAFDRLLKMEKWRVKDPVKDLARDSCSGARYENQLRTFISEYKDDGLLDYCPPREHKMFCHVKHKTPVKDPVGLGKALRDLSRRLDVMTDKYRSLRDKRQSQASESPDTVAMETSEVPAVELKDERSSDAETALRDPALVALESLEGVELFENEKLSMDV